MYGRSPKFTNEFEKRFDWGICDFNFLVIEGKIVEGKLFSDCLYVEYVDEINSILTSSNFTYNVGGFYEII